MPRRAASPQPTPGPSAALSTKRSRARPGPPPRSPSVTTPKLHGTRQVNAPSPVTATPWGALSALDNWNRRLTKGRSRAGDHGRTQPWCARKERMTRKQGTADDMARKVRTLHVTIYSTSTTMAGPYTPCGQPPIAAGQGRTLSGPDGRMSNGTTRASAVRKRSHLLCALTRTTSKSADNPG